MKHPAHALHGLLYLLAVVVIATFPAVRALRISPLYLDAAVRDKTEVALRAIFRVVLNSKQAALLAPTTILADQHFHSAKERFEKFGLKIALLTRLQSKSEQKNPTLLAA